MSASLILLAPFCLDYQIRTLHRNIKLTLNSNIHATVMSMYNGAEF